MVNGVILLVDAAEGPMPQTRFVLSKALELGHKVIIVINKIDRPDRRIDEVIDEVLELLIDLNADDEQLESPILFCSARRGIASADKDTEGTDLRPLFETILKMCIRDSTYPAPYSSPAPENFPRTQKDRRIRTDIPSASAAEKRPPPAFSVFWRFPYFVLYFFSFLSFSSDTSHSVTSHSVLRRTFSTPAGSG